jgi:hypothetical protein
MDQTVMNQAFTALRDRFGDRLVGDQIGGEVKMRQAVMAGLSVDESQADLMVKQLAHTGWIRFRGVGSNDDDAATLLTPGGNQAQGTSDEGQPLPLGSPQMDHGLMMEPMIAAAAQPGMAQGTSAGTNAGALGGAMVGAAAANLGRGARSSGEADDPTTNQDTVNSEAADENPPDGEGYWQLSGPPSAATTAAAGGGL